MDKLTVYYDVEGATLTVWFGSPDAEVSCEEVGDDTIIMKDVEGHVIGVEKLNVPLAPGARGVTVEVVPTAALITRQ